MLEAISLSFGLAMDATAVAAARGVERARPGDVVLLPLLFGVFQGGMVALGWAIGAWGGAYMAAAEMWIAFGLLILLGGKMILDSLKQSDNAAAPPKSGPLVYLGLALATSVDAAAAGLTLPLLPTPPVVSIVLVATITAACSTIGYMFGRAAGAKFGQRLGLLGGLVLVGLAVKLLVGHL